MKHLFGKHALVAVVAVLAVLCMTWPAQALKTHSGGVGNHLLFSYWTTADYKDTLVAIHSPLMVTKDFGDSMNLVRVVVRDMMGDELSMFDICLTPGDSWTAGISSSEMEGMSMLTVGSDGQCDGEIIQPGDNREGSPDNTPKMGEPMYIKGMGGFIEAYSPWLVELERRREHQSDADPPVITGNNSEKGRFMDTVGPEDEDGSMNEVDLDTNPEGNMSQMITGVAFLVDTMMGYASAYNPVALTCHNVDIEANRTAANMVAEGDAQDDDPDAENDYLDDDPLRSCHRDFDLNGAQGDAGDNDGNLINALLTGGVNVATGATQGNRMNTERANLIGRWITAPEIAAETTVMVTLPGAAYDDHPLEFAKDEDMFDPVSLLIFDEMGMGPAPMSIMLDQAVNTCTFMADGSGGTDIMCNGEMVANVSSDRGGFRIYNSQMVTYKTEDDADTDVDETEEVNNDGAEDADGDMKYMAEADAMLPAIGLVHSHYDVIGIHGMGSYDHISPLLSTGMRN